MTSVNHRMPPTPNNKTHLHGQTQYFFVPFKLPTTNSFLFSIPPPLPYMNKHHTLQPTRQHIFTKFEIIKSHPCPSMQKRKIPQQHKLKAQMKTQVKEILRKEEDNKKKNKNVTKDNKK